MTTDWRPVPGYRGLYEVSNTGQVRSIERKIMRRNGSPYRVREHILRPIRHRPSGRAYVKLCSWCRYSNRYVDDLVAEAFGAAPTKNPRRPEPLPESLAGYTIEDFL